MLDEIYTTPKQDDVVRNWLIDIPNALNDTDALGNGRPVCHQQSIDWYAQDGALNTDWN